MKPLVLKKLHETELEILDEIDRICKIHHITYFLEGGTLLGAVRHKGFIPWDDDLDIAMPRNDFEKFLEICKSELSIKYDVLSANVKTYGHIHAKIQKKNTLFLEKNSLNIHNNINKWGIFIDIFPFDKANSSCATHIRRWAVKKMKNLIWRKMGLVENDSMKSKIINALLLFISVGFLKKCVDNLCRREENDDNCTHFISMGSQYKTKRALWLKDNILPVSQIEFEGKTYWAPHDPDYFLRIQFGNDYMQLPPIEKRVTHNPAKISFNTEEGYEEI